MEEDPYDSDLGTWGERCAALVAEASCFASSLDGTAPSDIRLSPEETAAFSELRCLLARLDEQLERWTGGFTPQGLGGMGLPGASGFGVGAAPSQEPSGSTRGQPATVLSGGFGMGRTDLGRAEDAPLDLAVEPAIEASVRETVGNAGPRRDDVMGRWLRSDIESDPTPEPKVVTVDPDSVAAPPVVGDITDSVVASDNLLPTLLTEVGGRATLQGDHDSLPVTALLELLSRSRQTGCLYLRTAVEQLRIALFEGAVVATASSDPLRDQRLGDWLVTSGLVGRDRVDGVAERAQLREMKLGALMLEEGLLTMEQLRAGLRAQIQARLDRVLRAEAVAYAFVPDRNGPDDPELRESLRELLLDCMRRHDESARS